MDFLILAVLFVVLAVVTAYEMAIFSTRPEHMRNASKAGDQRGTIVITFLRNPTRVISALQIAATFLGLAMGSFLQAKYAPGVQDLLLGKGVGEKLAPQLAGWTVVLGSTFLVLIFTNLIPKKLAYAYADPLSLKWARPAYLWVKGTSWLSAMLTWAADGLLKLFRIPIPKAPPVMEQDIEELLRQGGMVGTIDHREAEIIRHAFALSDTKVSGFMTPRKDICFIRLSDPDAANVEQIRRHSHSQFLAVERDLDSFVGMIRARDVLADPSAPIRSHLKPPLVLPLNATALDLLRGFKEEASRAAVIVGDHGRVMGIATFNDLVSILVGEAKSIA